MPRSPAMPQAIVTDLLGLVVSILREQGGRANTLQCTLLPPQDPYAVRLDALGDAGVAVLLPRRPLERALSEPQARAWVRHLVQSAINALHTRRATGAVDLAAYFTALDVRSLPGPRCTVCEGPILAEAPVVIRDGARWHVACPPAW